MLLLLSKPVSQALFEEVRCMLRWINRSLLDPDTESWTGRGVNGLSGSFRTMQAGMTDCVFNGCIVKPHRIRCKLLIE